MEWFEDELGVDEVGRGPLAGPVVVAAVWLPPGFDLTGLGDSKALTERQRQTQAARIRAEATFHVVAMTHDDVDTYNVLGATEEGMRRVQGPQVFISPAGTKRVGYAHSEVRWVTVHVNADDGTDVAAIEARLVEPWNLNFVLEAAAARLAP